MNKISDISKLKGKEIKFIFDKDNIIITFNENDKLYFCNNNGLIEKNFLFKKILFNNTLSKNIQKNEIIKDNPNDTIKEELEILIMIFYFDMYLREKENDSFEDLNKEKSEKVYLIDNLWMEEYKSFFDYKYLKCYLFTKYSDLSKKNQDQLSQEKIKNIIGNLPTDYINKINKKSNFDKSKYFKYEKKEFNQKIKYLNNNHIINSKNYKLLMDQKYKLNNSLKKADLFFKKKKKIILLFPVGIDANKVNH